MNSFEKLNLDNSAETPELEKIMSLSGESVEYRGKYQIVNWDFEYAEEHYERDVIMVFDKNKSTDYAIDKALDKIRTKLDTLGILVEWSKPINLQTIVDTYRKHTNDEKEKFYTVFETSGVFSIERLGYEELRDQILEKAPPHFRSLIDKKIKEAIERKLHAWKMRHGVVEI